MARRPLGPAQGWYAFRLAAVAGAAVEDPMPWSDLLGHEEVLSRFRGAMRRGRLASTFLFVGPAGIGKRTFANQLAQTLLCERAGDTFEACGNCAACRQVAAGAHPDLATVELPSGKTAIPIELFIGDREHRMQRGLLHHLSLKPLGGGRKIAIIDDADRLNVEGANCLLKTLEEPPPNSLLILIGTSEQLQLPTIRSRCQILRFRPLPETAIARLLLEREIVTNGDEAQRLAALSGGSMATARNHLDGERREFCDEWKEAWRQPQPEASALAKSLLEFVEAAGKETPPRRERLRFVIQHTAAHFVGEIRAADDARTTHLAATTAADCLDRCLAAEEELLMNAHVPTLIDCWVSDLTRLTRSQAL